MGIYRRQLEKALNEIREQRTCLPDSRRQKKGQEPTCSSKEWKRKKADKNRGAEKLDSSVIASLAAPWLGLAASISLPHLSLHLKGWGTKQRGSTQQSAEAVQGCRFLWIPFPAFSVTLGLKLIVKYFKCLIFSKTTTWEKRKQEAFNLLHPEAAEAFYNESLLGGGGLQKKRRVSFRWTLSLPWSERPHSWGQHVFGWMG